MTWRDCVTIVPVELAEAILASLLRSGAVVLNQGQDIYREATTVAWEGFRFIFLKGLPGV